MLAARAGSAHDRTTATASDAPVSDAPVSDPALGDAPVTDARNDGTMPPRIKNSPAARGGNGAAGVSAGQVKKIRAASNMAGCCDRDAPHRLKSRAYFAPIAGDRLHDGERRHRGGVGTQDARPERDSRGTRPLPQEGALRLVKSAFRTDQHGERHVTGGAALPQAA